MKSIRDFNPEEKKSEKNILEKVNEYKGLSENQLLSQLLSQVQKEKQNGSFDKNRLLSSIKMIEPYLTTEQKEKMQALVESL